MPEDHFLQEHLIHDDLQGRSSKCARCVVMEQKDASLVYDCNKCGQTKHLTEYSAIACKQHLLGERRAHLYKCYECQFPRCKHCEQRPEKPVSPNHLTADGSWLCQMHRYPPCSVCKKPKPATAKHRFARWTCSDCTGKVTTTVKSA